jgi:hypothetical protein
MSQPEMRCSERDETERDIPLMDLLDRWELPHKIRFKIQNLLINRILKNFERFWEEKGRGWKARKIIIYFITLHQ